MASIKIALPWPPSGNTYYRRVGHRTLISKRGRAYKQLVAALCLQAGVRPLRGDLSIVAVFCPPNRKKRDIDNLWKGLLDALKNRAYYDDSQIVDERGSWGEIVKGGRVEVLIETY